MDTGSEAQVNLQKEELAIRRASFMALLICSLCFAIGYFTLPNFFEFP